jgi:thiamine-phosphate pyrophosphorylase
MASAAERRARLDAARLYFVTGDPAVVPGAIAGGADIVQLRLKGAPDDEIVAGGRALTEVCHERGALFVLNDRPDLAVACGADGVHVGQDDEPLESARATVGPDMLVGISTHSPDQVDAADASDADYFAVGPVWETPTKEGRPAVGLELVRHAAQHARSKPWFAIGGIDAERAPLVAEAGARRIVVVRAIQRADDPRAAAASLRAALKREAVGGQAQ